jgi:hypothetical protein
MFNGLGRLLFTATAIAPVGLTYAWATYSTDSKSAAVAACGSIVLALLAVTFMRFAQKTFERVEIFPNSVEAADQENIAFLLLYLSPLFTSTFSQINWDVLLPTFLVFAAVVATGYNYHFSPLLGLMGWHSYKISDKSGVTYVIFTRRQMRATIDPLNVVQLTEYVLLDIGKMNAA